ncbi:putative ubiquitin-conjugating enzyme protein [Phialemonium atrogriseum]|uniref:Ubiquitin-conjugating enzyme E2 2 n=1 Tax=Phialemonium atrogriseum TaxID=1093897 RepID=A0AAJ0BX25_9PEZI|nr:putative ubiquitin-conjugating enzyme protein [Phialemonium atrogriseum]KAK1766074.1 putative ubiquitin-conjugating enzyme protein [Phialemonium atrogriseum]
MSTRLGRGGTSAGAKQRLMAELEALHKEKWVNFDSDQANLFRWRFALMVVNPDSDFNGGYFKAEMIFTEEYPYQPPKFRFLIPIYHPNVYPDGQLCISILHKPGEDIMSGEQASERWSPLQGAESVLRSVLLLLDDPEINSPANVDASLLYRDHRPEYNKKARELVERSKKDIPDGFVVPRDFEPSPPPKPESEDDDFWAGSDEEFDFGGSDTGDDDGEQEMADFEEDGDGEEDEEEEEQDCSDDEDHTEKR